MEPDTPDESRLTSADLSEIEMSAPAPEELESPRLGIFHLLALTACVAAYLGVTQTLSRATQQGTPPIGGLAAATGSAHAIGAGAALAGLILFAVRRLRGLRFPTHPGEYLLVILGVGAVLDLARSTLVTLLIFSGNFPIERTQWVFVTIELGTFGIKAAMLIWALVCVKVRRWRAFFLAVPVVNVAAIASVTFLARTMSPQNIVVASAGVPVLLSVVLAVVVIRDHAEGKRYPWTHWLGVGTHFWLDAARVGMLLLEFLPVQPSCSMIGGGAV